MKKSVLLSLMVIAIVAALVGGATFASWSVEKNINDNTFTTGVMDVTLALGDSATNFYPGATRTLTFTATNPNEYPIQVTQVTKTGLTFEGGLVDPGFTVTPIVPGAAIEAGGHATISVNVTMPYSASDDYQGKAGTIALKVKAEQQP